MSTDSSVFPISPALCKQMHDDSRLRAMPLYW